MVNVSAAKLRKMEHSEELYCPICRLKGKDKTTFICQDSRCFCSVCGYEINIEDKQPAELREEAANETWERLN